MVLGSLNHLKRMFVYWKTVNFVFNKNCIPPSQFSKLKRKKRNCTALSFFAKCFWDKPFLWPNNITYFLCCHDRAKSRMLLLFGEGALTQSICHNFLKKAYYMLAESHIICCVGGAKTDTCSVASPAPDFFGENGWQDIFHGGQKWKIRTKRKFCGARLLSWKSA